MRWLLLAVLAGCGNTVTTPANPCANESRCLTLKLEGVMTELERAEIVLEGRYQGTASVDLGGVSLPIAIGVRLPAAEPREPTVWISVAVFDEYSQRVGGGGITSTATDQAVRIAVAPLPASSCGNHVKDAYGESGIDCGWTCSTPCHTGIMCSSDSDCVSGNCEAHRCMPAPTCSDGVTNQHESDLDCGGPCKPCIRYQNCSGHSDCDSRVCRDGACATAVCSDHVQNQNESDVDCGGHCDKCADGKRCASAYDCASGICGAHGRCVPQTCLDGKAGDGELARDCGGVCAPCNSGTGVYCFADASCSSGVCKSGACAFPSCADGQRNGNESDIDCGGDRCGKCPNGLTCAIASDCQSGKCLAGTCQGVSCGNLVRDADEVDVDCGGPCARCGTGRACNYDTDCVSGACTVYCRATRCDDGVQNGDETGVDCGGPCGVCP
jgi:hypothetical protein